MSKNGKILYYLVVFAFVCFAISLMLTQVNMSGADEIESSKAHHWYGQFAFIGNVFVSFVSLYCFITYRKLFPLYITICYLLLVLLVTIGSFSMIGVFASTPTLFYSPKGIGTWINFGILFFMADTVYAPKLLNLFKYLCYLLFAFNFVQIAALGTVSNRQQALDAIRDTTVYLIWVYPFFFFDDTDKTNFAKILKYVSILFVAFFAFAIASRSYMLIVIFFFLIKLKRDLGDKKNSGLMVVMIGMMCLFGYYLVANIQSINSIKGLLSVFSGRIDEDSRSSQLKDFLGQYNYNNLFSGVGPLGTWYWIDYSKGTYEWLDNQFILLVWVFGIQTCLVYMFFLVYTVFRKNPSKDRTINNAKILVFFWILACGGFAIYVTFSTNLFYYFITLMIGIVSLNITNQTGYVLTTSRPRRTLPDLK
jgi:hypothetical protein